MYNLIVFNFHIPILTMFELLVGRTHKCCLLSNFLLHFCIGVSCLS